VWNRYDAPALGLREEGAAILYKAWVCDSPVCGYNLRIDRGEVTYGEQPQLKSAKEPRKAVAR